ncbi:MAG: hypothetical protein M5U01_42385 [Ardenticatenaceae bacterium]|nr:hypothetical protein [Ardenticatenaceae bacterium]HBY99470.1 hypothetical protein [Chloroflexota bacterium]
MSDRPYERELRIAEDIYARWERGICEIEGKGWGPRAKELHLCHRCGRICCDSCARPLKERRETPFTEEDGETYRAWAIMSATVERLLATMKEIRSYLVYEHDIVIKPGIFGIGTKKYRQSDGRPWSEITAEKEAELRTLIHEFKRIPHEYPLKMAAMVKTQVDYHQSQDYESKYSPYLCQECQTEKDALGTAPAVPKNLVMWHDE